MISNDYNFSDVNISHLKYFHSIKEKMPKMKNMNKFFITRICCCKTFRDKRNIYKKMEFEVNDHLEIFNFITMSILINNFMLNQDQLNNKSFRIFNDYNKNNVQINNKEDDAKDQRAECNIKKSDLDNKNTLSDRLLTDKTD